jgi:hypothetical protein
VGEARGHCGNPELEERLPLEAVTRGQGEDMAG